MKCGKGHVATKLIKGNEGSQSADVIWAARRIQCLHRLWLLQCGKAVWSDLPFLAMSAGTN